LVNTGPAGVALYRSLSAVKNQMAILVNAKAFVETAKTIYNVEIIDLTSNDIGHETHNLVQK